jgi:glycosyltransferase involved in cell wall biosynthesis
MYAPFDRARLEAANYIDLNTVVHRRALYDRLGGFDEGIARAVDWELLLRYTQARPAVPLPVLAARYRVRDRQRITDTVPIGPSWIAIRQRVDPPPVPARRPRILYVVWHYPQLSESYLEGEIRCLRRWGVDIAVWREVGPVSPYTPEVPVHEGDLEAVIRSFRPDAIHIHWLGFALQQDQVLDGLGLPVTLRMHGFDTTAEQFRKLLATSWLHRVYAFPRQLGLLDRPDARVLAVPSAFDTTLFEPEMDKDPRLVLRAGSCLPSKDIGLFFELAKRLPSHHFVFAGVTCNEFEHYPEELRRLKAELGSPVELRFDVPRDQMTQLMERAAIYLHTIHPPHVPFGAPIGMPISIAEAMATGAYVLVRDLPELVEYVGDAGAAYSDLEHAAQLIEATTHWSEDEWRRYRVRASDRGYLHHADRLVLRPILQDWCELARQRDARLAEHAGAA